MSLAELKYLHAREGDPSPLRAYIVSDGGHGAVGPAGISAKALPDAIIDAAGWLKTPNGQPYRINPTEVGGVTYRLTVVRGGIVVASVAFTPVAEGGVVDVNAIAERELPQILTPEQRARLESALARVDAGLSGAEQATQDASTAAAEARDAGAQAMLSSNVDVVYPDDATREAAAPADGTTAYTVASRLLHSRVSGAWAQVGEGAASATALTAQTQRLEIDTLADLLEMEGLSAGQTVIVQQAILGGTFAIRSGQDGDGVLSYNLPGSLTAHRLHTGDRIITAWAGVSPAATAAANSAALQNCLNVARDRGIPVVYTLPGEHAWGAACETYANIEITGNAGYTRFKATTDVGFFRTTSPSGEYATPGVRITNLVLKREAFPTRIWEIDLLDVSNPVIENVTVDCWGHISDRTAVSGVRVQVSRNDAGQVIKKATFLAEFNNVRCLNGSMVCANTDSKIVGGIAWGQMREFAILVDQTANVSIDGTEVIASPIHGGIYAFHSTAVQVGPTTRFDGSYDDVASGWGFFGIGGGGHSIDGHFYQSIYGSVYLKDTYRGSRIRGTHHNGNRINDPNCAAIAADGKAYPDIRLENSSLNRVYLDAHEISSPRSREGGGGTTYCLEEIGTSDANQITGGAAVGHYDFRVVKRLGANTIVRGIIGPGGKDVTRREVTVAWPNGDGTIIGAPHGLGAVPRTVHYPQPQTGNLGQARIIRAFADATNVYVELTAAPATAAPSFKVLVEV